ncbi:MAG: cysteine dioxygenase family protein [Pseudomonadota bacterium]
MSAFESWAVALGDTLQVAAPETYPALAEAALKTAVAEKILPLDTLSVADPLHIKGYGNHLIFEDESGQFHVRAMLFGPQQMTPIHDHRVWCALVCCTGQIGERSFRIDDKGQADLQAYRVLHTGMTSVAEPGDEQAHCLQNDASEIGITVHIYGGPEGPSALKFYNDLG